MTTATRHTRTVPTRPSRDGALGSGPDQRSRMDTIGLVGLRLAVGFEFSWAFLDKLLGLGYATPSANAWINGGAPSKGFLAGVTGGPLKGFFHSLSGATGIDALFMAALLGIGVALLLGVALRPAALAGGVLLMLMWFAVWPPATTAGGAPTHSTNPVVDSHVITTFALIVIAVLAGSSAGWLGRRWSALPLVRAHSWLR